MNRNSPAESPEEGNAEASGSQSRRFSVDGQFLSELEGTMKYGLSGLEEGGVSCLASCVILQVNEAGQG
jgi:hypothetical protein